MDEVQTTYTHEDIEAIDAMTMDEAASILKSVQDEHFPKWRIPSSDANQEFTKEEYKATKVHKAINLALKSMMA